MTSNGSLELPSQTLTAELRKSTLTMQQIAALQDAMIERLRDYW